MTVRELIKLLERKISTGDINEFDAILAAKEHSEYAHDIGTIICKRYVNSYCNILEREDYNLLNEEDKENCEYCVILELE